MRKRIVSLVLALMMCFSLSVTAFAVEKRELTCAEKIEVYSKLSLEEINRRIDEIANSNTRAPEPLGEAWLLAAAAARAAGYPCAAKMVQWSVEGYDYYESQSGDLIDTLKTTSAFANYMTAVRNNISTAPTSFEIKKSDNADLYYALHLVSVNVRQIGSGVFTTYTVTVNDVFDFARDNDYSDLFTTLVNNWAWLCQQTHALTPININLSILPLK